MLRRSFLVRAGQTVGAIALASAWNQAHILASTTNPQTQDWDSFRSLFNIDPQIIQMSAFFLASHPKPVREMIEEHRRALDANSIEYIYENDEKFEAAVSAAAAHYMDVNPGDIALTDSTTMGLGLLYSSLKLSPGQEILTTTHDHYSTETSLRLRAERSGTNLRRVSLYDDPENANPAQIIDRLAKVLTPKTRVVAVTWVHSCSGVKLPIAQMAEVIKKANASRAGNDRALLCVDGVHGLGSVNQTIKELNCDFFISGCHKWMFGPRGTGLVWGRPEAWRSAQATIPTFDLEAYETWMNTRPQTEIPVGRMMTPGGFHAFEHRWSVHKAFELHEQLGKVRVEKRINEQNRQLKEGLSKMPSIRLRTPMSEEVSAGITCFEVNGVAAAEAVQKLRAQNIVGSVTPYKTQYVRLAPGLLTTPEQVDQTLAAVKSIA